MKIARILAGLTGVVLVAVMLGCNDLGSKLAKILPSNAAPRQLAESGDIDAIDPSQIGGGNSSMAGVGLDETAEMNGLNDRAMGEEYSEMMGISEDEMAMEGMEDDGLLTELQDESQMMQLNGSTDGVEDAGDSEMSAEMQAELAAGIDVNMLEPAGSGDADGTGSLGGAMLQSSLYDSGGAQSLGGFGGGVGGMEKPENGRGPQKRSASKTPQAGIPNIRDRPIKSTAANPIRASNNSQKSAIQPRAQSPRTARPPSKPNIPAADIRVPGNITSPVYTLINNVAVPILLQNGTAMSFSTEILQQRNLTSKGTVYWVVHSPRLGFIRFPVATAGGRVSGVGAKFTPTSGPFQAFIIAVEANGEIKHLSSPVNVQWNP